MEPSQPAPQRPSQDNQPPVDQSQMPVETPVQNISPSPQPKSKKTMIVVGVVALVLLLIVGGVVMAIVRKSDETADDTSETTDSSSVNTTNNESPNDSSTGSDTDDVKSGSVSIDIQGFAFNPEVVKVKKGTKVTWTNQDSAAHTVTSDSGSDKDGLDSESLAKGDSYSFTFDTVGRYDYHCTPHPNMTASVEVVE